MKVQFEKREREILAGLLCIAQSAAAEGKSDEEKEMAKKINKLVTKFMGDSAYVSIKRDYLQSLGIILEEVIQDTKFDEELPKGQKPKMLKEDYEVCVGLLPKIQEYLK